MAIEKSEWRILWILLNELAEETGFGPLDPKEKIETTCKRWLEYLAQRKLERHKSEEISINIKSLTE